jgi:serine/threonine-protein kinase RsbW
MLTYRATLPRGFGSVRKARRALHTFAQTCGFRDTTLADVESAVGEALANAAEHSGAASERGLDVAATFDGQRLVIEICDHGPGFDTRTALARRSLDPAACRGFGIFLMRTLMDEVAFSERGSCIQLVKRLDEPSVTSSH